MFHTNGPGININIKTARINNRQGEYIQARGIYTKQEEDTQCKRHIRGHVAKCLKVVQRVWSEYSLCASGLSDEGCSDHGSWLGGVCLFAVLAKRMNEAVCESDRMGPGRPESVQRALGQTGEGGGNWSPVMALIFLRQEDLTMASRDGSQ